MVFNKKAQLGMIEFKFFVYGLILGIVVGLALTYMGNAGIIPFQMPVCG
tara:strand:- start:253 stop:399 length:147 start_codon:yes stop_codon:yes gene_type:complete